MKTTIGISTAALLAGAVLLAAVPTLAQNAPNIATAPAAGAGTASGVARVNAAMQLAELGREQNDPMLLVAAARTVIAVGQTPGDDVMEGGAIPAGEGAPAPATPQDRPEFEPVSLVDQLLEEALQMARGNATVIAAIEETAAMAGRGTVVGPHHHDVRMEDRAFLDHREIYRGGEQAEFAIIGDGTTDVDIHVYDEFGNLICSSTSARDIEYCSWVPLFTGEFRVRISNYGYVWNDVRILTN